MSNDLVTRKNGPGVIRERVKRGCLIGMAAWGQLVAQRARLKAPVKTGRLARSVHEGEPFEAGEFIFAIEVGTNVEYARAQEEGSGMHALDPARRELILIEAKRAQSLAFAWPAGPKESPAYDAKSGLFFFKRVWHPGVRPQPYLRPAIAESKPAGRVLLLGSLKAALEPG